MEILIADDDPMSLKLISALVLKLGHTVLLVQNGEDAVHAFESHRPDLVLMDGQMPVLDGFAAASRIRELSGQHWTPILFIAAENDQDTIVRAFDAGADDYLVKPVLPAMLRAKLAAVARVHKLYREGEAQKKRLQNYRDTAEHEGRIALHLMQKLVNAEQLDDPMLKYMIVPISPNFSGDLVAAARTPRGALHVMLADAVGHGLAAALNVLPIVPCFYSMIAKGFDLDMIATELNRTLRQYMPVDRFVATTLISVDPVARRIKVWNGANPPVVAFTDDGAVIARFESKNLAFGIVSEAAFEPVVEVFDYPVACQLFACSDGVIEDYGQTADGAARQLRVERMLAETPPALRLKRMRTALAARTGDGTAHDDMTVVLLNCDAAAVASLQPPPRMPAQWYFEVTFDADDLRKLGVPNLLLDVVSSLPGAHFHRRQLGIIVSELFANALDHGVLGLPPREARDPARRDHARAMALGYLEQGSIAVHIESHWTNGRPLLELQFRDSGKGFVGSADAADGAITRGRGIERVRALCASVDFRGSGNDVRVTYVLDERADVPLRAVA